MFVVRGFFEIAEQLTQIFICIRWPGVAKLSLIRSAKDSQTGAGGFGERFLIQKNKPTVTEDRAKAISRVRIFIRIRSNLPQSLWQSCDFACKGSRRWQYRVVEIPLQAQGLLRHCRHLLRQIHH